MIVHRGATLQHRDAGQSVCTNQFDNRFLIWKLLHFVVRLLFSQFLFIFLEKSVRNIFFALFDFVQSTEK